MGLDPGELGSAIALVRRWRGQIECGPLASCKPAQTLCGGCGQRVRVPGSENGNLDFSGDHRFHSRRHRIAIACRIAVKPVARQWVLCDSRLLRALQRRGLVACRSDNTSITTTVFDNRSMDASASASATTASPAKTLAPLTALVTEIADLLVAVELEAAAGRECEFSTAFLAISS